MNKAKRAAVIAGNWKMNKSRAEAKALVEELCPLVKDADCGVIVCTPYLDLETAVSTAAGSNIKVGAQNCHWAEHGAFTGEIPAAMLKDVGAEYVIIGHSERRQYFGETDETVNKRVRAALDGGLKVILCCGELLAEREQGIIEEIVGKQVKVALGGVSAEELKNMTFNVPETVGGTVAEAKAKISAAKLECKVVGSGETVLSHLPEAGSKVISGGVVIVYTEEGGSEQVTVPNLVGLTPTEDNSLAAGAKINVEFSGNTSTGGLKSHKRSVEAGQSVDAGTVITVYFRDENVVDG